MPQSLGQIVCRWRHLVRIAVIGLRGLLCEGGIESYCRYICPGIVARNHEVTVYTRRQYGRGKTFGPLAVSPVPSFGFGGGVATFTYSLIALAHAIISRKFDVIYFQAIGSAIFAPLARLAGLAVVVRHVGADWQRPKWGVVGRTVLRLAEWAVARYATVVICLNEDISKGFLERQTTKAEVLIIRNAVPKPAPVTNPDLLRQYDVQSERYILAVSRVTPEKGLHSIISAFDATALASTGWKLVIAGRFDPACPYSQRIAGQVRATAGAVLTGELMPHDVSVLFANAAIYVNASSHEGMSFSLLEGLSHGVPPIVSDIPANTRICDGLATVIPAENTQELANAMTRCATEPMRSDERQALRALITRHHDLDTAIDATTHALERSLELTRAGLHRSRLRRRIGRAKL